MKDYVIKDELFSELMKGTAELFLSERRRELRLPRDDGKALYFVCYDAENAVGTVIISHGFTETAEKYPEVIYYFLIHRYNVCLPEHCGHGRSYRLVDDLSLVHIDSYERYVYDLLAAADVAKKEHPGLPLYVYGHSMGGGVAAAALSVKPELFERAVLSSPMIRPLTGDIPWSMAKLLANILCLTGKSEQYVPGGHAFDGNERFEDSAATSRERFEYYQTKRCAEPLFQMSAASCGWLKETAKLNHYLMKHGWKRIKTPLLIFRAQDDGFVSGTEQVRFAEKVSGAGKASVTLKCTAGSRHEIFNSEWQVLENYWQQVFSFLCESDS